MRHMARSAGRTVARRTHTTADKAVQRVRMTTMPSAVGSAEGILAGMSTDDRGVLARIAARRRLRAGDFVYMQGDSADHFYIVESGGVRIFYQTPAGREPTVILRGPGDLFGISHLADHSRRVTSAQALEPSAIWAISNDHLDELTRRLPTLASRIIRSLAARLRDVMVMVESVATWPARLRVANFLLANLDRPGRAEGAVRGWTHESVADRLGCTRQTVTEALNEFARRGWIRVERKRVSIIDQRALERLIGGESTAIQVRSRKPGTVPTD